jgi:DNA polymerase-3 subunit epsilon
MVLKQGKIFKNGDLLHYMLKITPKYILVCDIETTGLDVATDMIIEIGIVKLDLSTGRLEKIFNQIVREDGFNEKFRSAWIFSNSDLQFNEVMNAPLLTDFKQELQDIFHFKRFFTDIPMMTATPILQLPAKYTKTGFKYPSVDEAWSYYYPNKQYKESHRAYDDAVHEAQIILTMFHQKHWELKSN